MNFYVYILLIYFLIDSYISSCTYNENEYIFILDMNDILEGTACSTQTDSCYKGDGTQDIFWNNGNLEFVGNFTNNEYISHVTLNVFFNVDGITAGQTVTLGATLQGYDIQEPKVLGSRIARSCLYWPVSKVTYETTNVLGWPNFQYSIEKKNKIGLYFPHIRPSDKFCLSYVELILCTISTNCSKNSQLNINTFECECIGGWTGTDCHSCPLIENCLNNSTLALDTCMCICQDGWFGKKCEICNSDIICSANGVCNDTKVCSCNEFYYGEHCEFFCSPLTCDHNDKYCTSDGICTCINGLYGKTCLCEDCNTGLGNCSDRGVCMSSRCICNLGYVGCNCEYHCTSILNCSGNGECNNKGECDCWDINATSNCTVINDSVDQYTDDRTEELQGLEVWHVVLLILILCVLLGGGIGGTTIVTSSDEEEYRERVIKNDQPTHIRKEETGVQYGPFGVINPNLT